MSMFTSYGHINKPKKITDYLMILSLLCRFNIIYQILFLSAAVRHPTIHELTETAADPDGWGGGYLILHFQNYNAQTSIKIAKKSVFDTQNSLG